MSNRFFEREPLPSNLITFPGETITPELSVGAGPAPWQQELEKLINCAMIERTVKSGPLWTYFVTRVTSGVTFATGWTQMNQLVDPRLSSRRKFGGSGDDSKKEVARLSSAQERLWVLSGLMFLVNRHLMSVEGEWKREESKDGEHYFLQSEGRREVYLVRTIRFGRAVPSSIYKHMLALMGKSSTRPRFMYERLMFSPDQTLLEEHFKKGMV